LKYKCKVCGGTADRLKICCGEEMIPIDEKSEEEDEKRVPQE
jgi:hypothetical protein